MKIKNLMEFLNKNSEDPQPSPEDRPSAPREIPQQDDNIVYIENSRLETVAGDSSGKDILAGGTQWVDAYMGDILISLGCLDQSSINKIIDYQREKGLYFGEAGVELGLLTKDDILKALSRQFGYSYAGADAAASKEMVMASAPFSEVAEEFRAIRAQLLNDWLTDERKTLAIVSPGAQEGRSYFAANIALSFSQLGKATLLIDADLRTPRQHDIFGVAGRVGLSPLLAGRVKMEELDSLPDNVSSFPHLSVLSCGPVPPNPTELLSNDKFARIVRRLEEYFDVIIVDTPAATYKADVLAITSVAGSALLMARRGYSRLDEMKALRKTLEKARALPVGAVINQN